jgi:hypothetical protein
MGNKNGINKIQNPIYHPERSRRTNFKYEALRLKARRLSVHLQLTTEFKIARSQRCSRSGIGEKQSLFLDDVSIESVCSSDFCECKKPHKL